MLTITIQKSELKKAFFGGEAEYAQELTPDGEALPDVDKILLQIMMEVQKIKEAA